MRPGNPAGARTGVGRVHDDGARLGPPAELARGCASMFSVHPLVVDDACLTPPTLDIRLLVPGPAVSDARWALSSSVPIPLALAGPQALRR
jgi:hypothetical protein